MKKCTIIVNTLKHNRGTEALVRGTVCAIKKKYPQMEIYVVANDLDIEQMQPVDGVERYICKNTISRKKPVAGGIYMLLKKVLHLKGLAAQLRYKKVLDIVRQSDVTLCVGADNFDYHYGMFNNIVELHSLLREKCPNTKLVLFDCSISKDDISDGVKQEIGQFKDITVREPATLRVIREICPDTRILYHADPAFIMPLETVSDLVFDDAKTYVGVNLSGVVLEKKYGGDSALIWKSYEKLIATIKDYGFTPIFIPHVMDGSDSGVLNELKCRCSDEDILVLDRKYNAAQLKYCISRCTFFVGARTHSTIAAYSSGVPTLVVGYSIKSIGIAEELFGTSEHYVLPVDELKNVDSLSNEFKFIVEHRSKIKKQLEMKIPALQNTVYEAMEVIASDEE